MGPPWAIHSLRTVHPFIPSAVVRGEGAIATGIGAKRRNALAFAQSLVEHAIGAAVSGSVANKVSLNDGSGGGCD